MKCSEVVFDSEKDNWGKNTSVFDDKILGKSHLIFVIEDTNGNKFGYYLSSNISSINNEIFDEHAFLFTLKNNGRITEGNGMMKFEHTKKEWACCVKNKGNHSLFGIGERFTLCLMKSNCKGCSFYEQYYDCFDYHGTHDVIIGRNETNKFTPKRIVVIQMK